MAIAKDGMSESARKELTESRRRIEELTSQLAKLSSEVGSQSLQLSTLDYLGKALAMIQKLPVQNERYSKFYQSSSYLSHYKTKPFHQSWPTSASLQDWETGL